MKMRFILCFLDFFDQLAQFLFFEYFLVFQRNYLNKLRQIFIPVYQDSFCQVHCGCIDNDC